MPHVYSEKMRNIFYIILILLLALSCEDDEILTNKSAKLSFSADTIKFDTVFTGIGSATKRMKVYNRNNQPVNISSIQLAKGQQSQFSMNVDGESAIEIRNKELPANDSIFVFVEVNIDPAADDMIENDSIVFQTNGNIQAIKTVAFGRNVELIDGKTIDTRTWTTEKPYLIYNSSFVDTLETLTINAGTEIYFHKGASLFVLGTLNVNGSKAQPVTFQGDRLEPFYEDKPGQWGDYTTLENGATYVFGGIHFLPGSNNNTINYAIIKNANKGIQLDSAVGTNPALTISNTIISHMNLAGIYAQSSTIAGHNLVINNCGSHAIALTLGGAYNFNHITIANYTPYNSRNTASVALNNYYTYNGAAYVYTMAEATFTNSIIYGDGGQNGDEIVIDQAGEDMMNYCFDHCIIKTGDDFQMDTSHFKNIIHNPPQGPRFLSRTEYKFELDTLSPAVNAGAMEFGTMHPQDLKQNSRVADEAPDIGAYERQ